METEFKIKARPEDKYSIDYIGGYADSIFKVVKDHFNMSDDEEDWSQEARSDGLVDYDDVEERKDNGTYAI